MLGENASRNMPMQQINIFWNNALYVEENSFKEQFWNVEKTGDQIWKKIIKSAFDLVFLKRLFFFKILLCDVWKVAWKEERGVGSAHPLLTSLFFP